VSLLDKFLNSRNNSPGGEMAFVDHIEELRWNIIRSVIAVLIGSIVVFFNIEWIFDHIILGPAHADFISYKVLCDAGNAMHLEGLCLQDINLEFQNTELSGQFMMSFSVSFMIGFICAFPYIFWEFWKFIKPALKPEELKYARGIVFWTSLLFFTGVLFAYYVIAPFTINFFANYQLSPSFKNIITMSNYYDTMSDLILGIGLVFELPVVVYFFSRIGLLNPTIMRAKRNYAIIIILFLAAIITPPDFLSLWLVAIPMFILYEAGIVVSQRVVKNKTQKQRLNR
jgi:sec-independent protein translocase protein TatC